MHQQRYLCMQASETFEQKDCFGSPHIDILSPSLPEFLEYLIGDWIKVKK